MISKLRHIACTLVAGALVVAPTHAQQVASEVRPLVEEVAPGWINVNLRVQSAWLNRASDALAARNGKILVRCGVIEEGSEATQRELSGHSLRLPDNLDAMRQIAALSGSEIVELSPEVLLLRSVAGTCDEPLLLTAQRVAELGRSVDPGLDEHALELALFRAVGDKGLGPVGLFGQTRSAVYYWGAREGTGRELYVQTQSTANLLPKWPLTRGLYKVVVEGTGARLSVRRLWGAGCDGPVATLEFDFDRDGATDIVCFSGDWGGLDGSAPLVVISGASGKRIGEFDGREFVITEVPEGLRIRAEGQVDDHELRASVPITRTYTCARGTITLEAEQRGKAWGAMTPLTERKGEGLLVKGAAAGERVVLHFLESPYSPTDPPSYRGLPAPGRVGAEMPEVTREGVRPSTTHVILDYRPKKPE